MRFLSLFLVVMMLFSSGSVIASSPDTPAITGTAFFVSENGMAVTNHHVIKDCERFVLFDPQVGWTAEAHVVDVDAANDLVLLQADVKSKPLPVTERFALKRGEDVLTLGYPSPGVQGARQKATFGRLNADSGSGDDIRHVQVDVPVQPGNSGGPLLNAKGEVVGVINARLQGGFQNVSYAVKVDYLRPLLDKASIKAAIAPFFSFSSMADVVERCQDSVVMVLGYRAAKHSPDIAEPAQSKKRPKPSHEEIQETLHAAEQGDAIAQSKLGHWYALGWGVLRNRVKAMEWLLKAAEQGYAPAQFRLGVIYDEGKEVQKDTRKAVQWFHKAAEQGFASAQHSLGWMYERGDGVQRNYENAVEWYRKAAEQGNTWAQFDLGVMYATGRGVSKNEAMAAEWYIKAGEEEATQHYIATHNAIIFDEQDNGIADRKKNCALWRAAGEQGVESAIKAYKELCTR
jgi:TPR repeat protein